jgi:hypothetical protein
MVPAPPNDVVIEANNLPPAAVLIRFIIYALFVSSTVIAPFIIVAGTLILQITSCSKAYDNQGSTIYPLVQLLDQHK